MTNQQCFFADRFDKVVCSSKLTWTNLSEFRNEKVELKCFPDAEATLEVMLLKADMFFQHKFNMDRAYVCDAHRNILLQKCYLKDKSKYDVCLRVRRTIVHGKADLRYINVSQAITLFDSFQLKNSYGKLICRRCRGEVSNKNDITREELYYNACECLFDPESVCCMEDSMEDKDLDYQPPVNFLIDEEKSKRQITALNCFLAACGSNKRVNVTISYKDLSHRVKLRYVNLITFLMRAATSLVA